MRHIYFTHKTHSLAYTHKQPDRQTGTCKYPGMLKCTQTHRDANSYTAKDPQTRTHTAQPEHSWCSSTHSSVCAFVRACGSQWCTAEVAACGSGGRAGWRVAGRSLVRSPAPQEPGIELATFRRVNEGMNIRPYCAAL